jgi:predicted RNA binding protein YcfA (HicA-like mRNA interferase family)
MKLPRDLSGEELVRALCREFGYERIHQEGSHMLLQTDHPQHHRIAVPAHHPLRPGTLNAILRAVATVQGIDKQEILRRL